MNDKERLEEIKNSYLEGLHRLFGTPWVSMPKENFDWLIQQAERAEKNAQDLEDMDKQLASEQKRVEKLEKDLNALHYVYNLQAERVEELEKTRVDWEIEARTQYAINKRLEKENKRYKQALEFYADEEHYKEKLISEAQYDADGICISNDEYAPPIIYFDSGETARQALKGETK